MLICWNYMISLDFPFKFIQHSTWITTGARAHSATLWRVSDLTQLMQPTNCTKQVLTNQSKRMFALLTFCKRLHCKRNRQRRGSFGLLAVCRTDEIKRKKKTKVQLHCGWLPLTWCGRHRFYHLFLYLLHLFYDGAFPWLTSAWKRRKRLATTPDLLCFSLTWRWVETHCQP